MNKSQELVKTLEQFYNHNSSSIVGYLMAVLIELERDVDGAKEVIQSHTDWIGTGLDKE